VLKVLHYLNQFFAGLGGEEHANVALATRAGPVGPGVLLARLLQEQRHDVEFSTVWCGDTYAAEHLDEIVSMVTELVQSERPDVVVLGPAFNAGRYGLVCGELATQIPLRTGVPALTGLHEESAAVGMFRSTALIVRTARSAVGMADAMKTMSALVPRLVAGEHLDDPEAEGLYGSDRRRNRLESRTAADRAVDVLLQLLRGVDVGTELALPDIESVPVPPPVADLSATTIALVTEGGLVPKGNPDRLTTGASERWGAYRLDELATAPSTFESIHGGYDTRFVNERPFRLVPIDVVSELVDQGRIGALHPKYYVTSGTATKVENCRRMGSEIAEVLRNEGIQAVILTGT
jgi:glycine reductase